jgi:hypothetical protein
MNRACEAGGCFAKGVGARASSGTRPQRLQISGVFSMIFRRRDLQRFALICTCFTVFFEGREVLICSDLRDANQAQISANQRSENHMFQRFANHVICGDLQLICG